MTEQEFNEKLQKAKIEFEKILNQTEEDNSKPFANYIAVKNVNNTIYISGQLPRDLLNNNNIITGKASDNNEIFDAKYAAAMCAMQILLVLKNEIKDLSKIQSCVQLQVFVNSTPDFTNQHLVANGASDLICEYFEKAYKETGLQCQESGLQSSVLQSELQYYKEIAQHTRCAVGVATLPLGALVEV